MGSVDLVRGTSTGVEVLGWVALPPGAGSPTAAWLLLDERPIAAASLGQRRLDVAATLQRPELADAGFRALVLEKPLTWLIGDGIVCPTALRVVDGRAGWYSDLPVPPNSCLK